MGDAFSRYHPAVNFVWFFLTLLFSACLMQPVCLVLSLTASGVYLFTLTGREGARFCLRISLPLMAVMAGFGPLFQHAGATVLGYLPDGNPVTMESILYALFCGCMMAGMLQWFRCGTCVLTTDKFLYLFGRAVPALSLVLSMALRFFPRFHQQYRQVNAAQRGLGQEMQGGLRQRIRVGSRTLSIMISWSLENAVETADSMKSRGYSLPGRTAYSRYRWERRDTLSLIWLGLLGAGVAVLWARGALTFSFFPFFRGALGSGEALLGCGALGLLFLFPVLAEMWERAAWRRSGRALPAEK